MQCFWSKVLLNLENLVLWRSLSQLPSYNTYLIETNQEWSEASLSSLKEAFPERNKKAILADFLFYKCYLLGCLFLEYSESLTQNKYADKDILLHKFLKPASQHNCLAVSIVRSSTAKAASLRLLQSGSFNSFRNPNRYILTYHNISQMNNYFVYILPLKSCPAKWLCLGWDDASLLQRTGSISSVPLSQCSLCYIVTLY